MELDVGYEGVIPLDVTRLTRIGVPEDKAKHTEWDQISKSFTAVRGIGYVGVVSSGNGGSELVGSEQRSGDDWPMEGEIC